MNSAFESAESLVPYLQKEKAKLARISVDQAERIRLLEAETLSLRSTTHRLEFERDSYMTEWYSLAKDLIDRSTGDIPQNYEHWELVQGVANARRRLHGTRPAFVKFFCIFVNQKISSHFAQFLGSLHARASGQLETGRFFDAWRRFAEAQTRELTKKAMRLLADRRRKRQVLEIFISRFRPVRRILHVVGNFAARLRLARCMHSWRMHAVIGNVRKSQKIGNFFAAWKLQVVLAIASTEAATKLHAKISLAKKFAFWQAQLRQVSEAQLKAEKFFKANAVLRPWLRETGKSRTRKFATMRLMGVLLGIFARLGFRAISELQAAVTGRNFRSALLLQVHTFATWRQRARRLRVAGGLDRKFPAISDPLTAGAVFRAWRAASVSRVRVVFARPEIFSIGNFFFRWRRLAETRTRATRQVVRVIGNFVARRISRVFLCMQEFPRPEISSVERALEISGRREAAFQRRLWLATWRGFSQAQRHLATLRSQLEKSIESRVARTAVSKFAATTNKRYSLQQLELALLHRGDRATWKLLHAWRRATTRTKLNLQSSQTLSLRRRHSLQSRVLTLMKATLITASASRTSSRRSSSPLPLPRTPPLADAATSPVLAWRLPLPPVAAAAAVDAGTSPRSGSLGREALEAATSPVVSPAVVSAAVVTAAASAGAVAGAARLWLALRVAVAAAQHSCFQSLRPRGPCDKGVAAVAATRLVPALTVPVQRQLRRALASLAPAKGGEPPARSNAMALLALASLSEKAGAQSGWRLAQAFKAWRDRAERLRALGRVLHAACCMRPGRAALADLRRHGRDAAHAASLATSLETAEEKLVASLARNSRRFLKTAVLVQWRAVARLTAAAAALFVVALSPTLRLRLVEIFRKLQRAKDAAVTKEIFAISRRLVDAKELKLRFFAWRAKTGELRRAAADWTSRNRSRILAVGMAGFTAALRQRRATLKLTTAVGAAAAKRLSLFRGQLLQHAWVATCAATLRVAERRLAREKTQRLWLVWRLALCEHRRSSDHQVLATAAHELAMLREEVQKAARRAGLLGN